MIEQYDSFQKQTYRNRCMIATANGTQVLTVPVEHSSQSFVPNSQLVKDLHISDHNQWRRVHWNALQSAYSESPFFEYYADDLHPFFEQKYDYLLDFNEAIRVKMCELIDIQPRVNYSKSWSVECGEWSEDTQRVDSAVTSASESNLTPHSTLHTSQSVDYRSAIRPKNPEADPDFESRPYYQVWQQKNGFLANLSILDLLFNMGNESVFYL
jgi:hypothetical protein